MNDQTTFPNSPAKRGYHFPNRSEGSISTELSELNMTDGGYTPTAPDDTTLSWPVHSPSSLTFTGTNLNTNHTNNSLGLPYPPGHRRTTSEVTQNTTQYTFYSVESGRAPSTAPSLVQSTAPSGAPSTLFHSILAPSVARSQSTTLSNRRLNSLHGSRSTNMASLKIFSPEEILRLNHYGIGSGNDSPTSNEQSPRFYQEHPIGPWTPASHPSKFMGTSTRCYGHPDDPSTILAPPGNGTRLASSDTKIIMNISTPSSSTKHLSFHSSVNSFTSTSERKNKKLLQQFEHDSQNNLHKMFHIRSFFRNSSETLPPKHNDINCGSNCEHCNHKPEETRAIESNELFLVTLIKSYTEMENNHGFFSYLMTILADLPTPQSLIEEADSERPGNTPPLSASGRIHLVAVHYARLLSTNLFFTFSGLLVTFYFLLVAGFAIFLAILLADSAPGMSHKWGPDDVQNSQRDIWIEICTQVLTGLFCITGLGLFPTRARDFFLIVRGQILGDIYSSNRILRIHSNWFWAGFSGNWKLVLVGALFMVSSVLQVLLCVAMWHLNRETRPAWMTASLISVSSAFVIVAGFTMLAEARRIKAYCYATGYTRQNGLSFSLEEIRKSKEESFASL